MKLLKGNTYCGLAYIFRVLVYGHYDADLGSRQAW